MQKLNLRDERRARFARRYESHVEGLNRLVDRMREARNEQAIPYFDPDGGGQAGRCLFLLEAPGPKAVETQFVALDNPDPTAANMTRLLAEASICPSDAVTWNVVPWFIAASGSSRIRHATWGDLAEAKPWLDEVVRRLSKLEMVVTVGAWASRGWTIYAQDRTNPIQQIVCGHPSNSHLNRDAPRNRDRILAVLREVGRRLAEGRGTSCGSQA